MLGSVTASQGSDGGHERLWWWQWPALGCSSWWQQTFRQMSNLPATPRPRMLHFTPSLNHISHGGSHSLIVVVIVSQLPRRPGSNNPASSNNQLGELRQSEHIPIMNSFLASNQQLPLPRNLPAWSRWRGEKGGRRISLLHIFPSANLLNERCNHSHFSLKSAPAGLTIL